MKREQNATDCQLVNAVFTVRVSFIIIIPVQQGCCRSSSSASTISHLHQSIRFEIETVIPDGNGNSMEIP